MPSTLRGQMKCQLTCSTAHGRASQLLRPLRPCKDIVRQREIPQGGQALVWCLGTPPGGPRLLGWRRQRQVLHCVSSFMHEPPHRFNRLTSPSIVTLRPHRGYFPAPLLPYLAASSHKHSLTGRTGSPLVRQSNQLWSVSQSGH